MKIILEIPDHTICAFFNYVEYKPSGLTMGVKTVEADVKVLLGLVKGD